MMVFKRKQIVVLSLVIMLVVAGYLQYSYKQSSDSRSGDNQDQGTAVFVDNLEDDKEASGEDAGTKDVASNFFVQARMDRETARSKDISLLEAITKDENASEETKNNAYNQMMKLTEISQQETRIETLIKKEGFEDVLVLFGDDGSIDIVVKADELMASDVAKISDVASRQANVPMTNIIVRLGK